MHAHRHGLLCLHKYRFITASGPPPPSFPSSTFFIIPIHLLPDSSIVFLTTIYFSLCFPPLILPLLPHRPFLRFPLLKQPSQSLPSSFVCLDSTTNGAAVTAEDRSAAMAKSTDKELPQKAFGWAATDTSGVLAPFQFSRRETGEEDVTVKVQYCGVCHSDLHSIKNEWGFTNYPIIPGHEIVGIVTKVGPNVKKFKEGDRVGVGVIVGSCKSCDCCHQHLENYCSKPIFTYNSPDKDGTKTYGGYSDIIVVNQEFVLRFPDGLAPDAGAPLLCAGITVYSPMKYYGMTEPGKHLGVAGLGGLGHVAIKLGKAFGLKVTVISSSPKKEAEALQRLKADSFVVTSDPEKMKAAFGTLDYIINTVSAVHALAPLLSLLKVNGKLVNLGLPEKPLELPVWPLVLGRKMIGGSNIGGIEETQEMLDFCAKHGVTADIELIRFDEINKAMERLAKSDVRYRFVIDVAGSLESK